MASGFCPFWRFGAIFGSRYHIAEDVTQGNSPEAGEPVSHQLALNAVIGCDDPRHSLPPTPIHPCEGCSGLGHDTPGFWALESLSNRSWLLHQNHVHFRDDIAVQVSRVLYVKDQNVPTMP